MLKKKPLPVVFAVLPIIDNVEEKDKVICSCQGGFVKHIFRSVGAYIGALVLGFLPFVSVFSSDLDFLKYLWGINPFLWVIAISNVISGVDINNYVVAFVIFGTNLIMGFILGWLAEIIIFKNKIEEQEVRTDGNCDST